MALSDRVKDVFKGSDSDPDAVRPPGSFPTDDMTPNSENTSTTGSHQRNKLHKPNDPRGKGHGHSDSGVGLESSKEPALTKEPVEEAYAPAEGYEERREHAKRSDVAEFDDVKADQHDTTEYNVDPKNLGTTAGTTTGATISRTDDNSSSHNEVHTGTTKSTVDHQDPYWGNLPQGQGVYNTVSGHGSNSDEARRQHATEDTEQRSFPLVTDRTRQHHEEHTTHQSIQPDKAQEKKDSHWKEGAAGAAVTGAAGTAAYKATRDDEDHSKTAHTEETPEEKEKKGRGGLFGVFHRGSKDDKDQTKDKEHHHKDKEHHHKEKEHHHDDKHHKEEKVAPVAAAGYAARNDKRESDNTTDNSRSNKTDPALAAAAVAYSQHSDDRHTSSTRANDPATRGNEGQYNTLSSGTASGVRTGDSGATDTRDLNTARDNNDQNQSNRNAALYGTAGAAALGAGGYAAHEYRKDHNDKNDSLAKDTREEPPRSGGWFTGPVTSTTQSTDPAQSQRDTYTADDSAKRSGGFAAAPVPTSSSTRDPAVDNYPSADDSSKRAAGFAAAPIPTTSSTTRDTTAEAPVREPSSEIPRVTDDANHGKYNHLSSGTPSGINVHEEKPTAASSLPTVADEKSNKGAMATAGIAAVGAGAGAAALASRRDDEKEKEPEKAEDKPLQRDTYTSTAIPGAVGGQQKVTHKCVKCGEENDISQYFKDKSRTGI